MVEVKRSPELEELAEESRRRYRAGDTAWFDERIADGELLMVGTAPGEEWRGRDAIMALNLETAETMNEQAGFVFEDEPEVRREAYEAGDTGWVITHHDFPLADGSRLPGRGITLFARDSDQWKIVLWEYAILVPNPQ
jgi:uncharacterized protein YciI